MRIAAMPARYALERGDWKAAMDLQPPQRTSRSSERSRYSRARRRDPGAHAGERRGRCRALESLHKALLEAKNNYWATEVEIQRLAVAAWIAPARASPRRR
jgi:hypothetical protein